MSNNCVGSKARFENIMHRLVLLFSHKRLHAGDDNISMHKGVWHKYSSHRHEIRGKTLGIVGYGCIGSQVSVLAENMGMRVYFYDVLKKPPLGNAVAVSSLQKLLSGSDFVTLHVPETPQTFNMIAREELSMMRKGSYLLNASRGTVVNIDDLKESLESSHLGGAYIDVFPEEPRVKKIEYNTKLSGLSNVLLTPHVGGATEEAQSSIGLEVAGKLLDFLNSGNTDTAVNFPNLSVSFNADISHRILNVHRNQPGVLKEINEILSEFNIRQQHLSTNDSIGYLIVDVDKSATKEIKRRIASLDSSIKTRILI